ncbi:MAG: hypothetical protein Q8O11_09470 [Syntrophales bacterium]|nr:hypothetical protein [Syntrophales bacterium]
MVVKLPYECGFCNRILPGRQRLWGIGLGAGGAVVVRVVCTFLVAQLLNPRKWVEYAAMVFFIAFVCGLSKWIANRRKASIPKQAPVVADGAR